MRDVCYMCDALAVGKEHAPPQSFFPEGYRRNLITVPSCADHNLKNSKDVEYVRNIICTQHGTNPLAMQAFETAKRSFHHSPRLLNETFSSLTSLRVEDEDTGAFRVDLKRYKKVMKAIAYALYFRDQRTRHEGDWEVFTPSLQFADSVYSKQADPWDSFRRYLESGKFTPVSVSQPEVFKYSVLHWEEGQLMYKLEFYENFAVILWTLPVKLSPLIFQPVCRGDTGTIWVRAQD